VLGAEPGDGAAGFGHVAVARLLASLLRHLGLLLLQSHLCLLESLGGTLVRNVLRAVDLLAGRRIAIKVIVDPSSSSLLRLKMLIRLVGSCRDGVDVIVTTFNSVVALQVTFGRRLVNCIRLRCLELLLFWPAN